MHQFFKKLIIKPLTNNFLLVKIVITALPIDVDHTQLINVFDRLTFFVMSTESMP